MTQAKEKEASKKKSYVAPKVMKVDLTAEEVMLGTCKASNDPEYILGRTGSMCAICASNIGS
jgi:hypothetical protein